jgi:hypothetical protein
VLSAERASIPEARRPEPRDFPFEATNGLHDHDA